MRIYLTETQDLSVKGLACELRVTISSLEADECDISASVWLKHTDVLLKSAFQFRAMYIPDDSLVDHLDEQVALASAEALLDRDALVSEAGVKLNRLSSVFADYFGLADRPEGV